MAKNQAEKPFGWGAMLVAVAGGYLLGAGGKEEAPLPMASNLEPSSDFAIAESPQTAVQPLFDSSRAYEEPYDAPEIGYAAPTYFANCSAARAAGAAPVRVGDPGYASHLDRDNDGIGCE